MLMPKKDRIDIFQYLFNEGVVVAKKSFTSTHPEIKVPNLHVIMLMKSLRSREFVRENFAWRHYYWYLTNEGIEYLRNYLHFPAEVVPDTLKEATTQSMKNLEITHPRFGYRQAEGSSGRRFGGDNKYKSQAPSDYKPTYRRGGFERGRGRGRGGFGRGRGRGGFRRDD